MICRYCKYKATCGDLSRTEVCVGKVVSTDLFVEIAEYANKNWAKGSFTEDEVWENAEMLYADLEWSRENGEIAQSIKTLCENLIADMKANPNAEEPKQWLYEIADELCLIDMDWHDYTETDEWL